MAGSLRVASYVKTRFSIAALFFAGAGTALAALAEDAPVDIAEAFCAAQTANDEKRLRTLMTADLVSVIAEAERRNAAIAETTGEAGAPLANGVPNRSSIDPPASCWLASVAPSDNLTILDIAYASSANGGQWTDRIVLKPEGGDLRIDDILFATFLTDTYNAGLRRVLADSFDQ
jgi:hypothetical protein